jgi:DNA damage-binding protein 1
MSRPTLPQLVKTATARVATAPTDLDVKGNLIAISDVMKSITILKLSLGTQGMPDRLVELARHQQAVWSTAVSILDDDTYLEGDADGNILMLARNKSGLTEHERKRLDVTADFRLGEMINRIQSFQVASNPASTVIPRAFLATVYGSIFLFASVVPKYMDLLLNLQIQLATHLAVPGTSSDDSATTETNGEGRLRAFNTFRAFRNQHREMEEPYRIIDGELIEKFLIIPDKEQQSIAAAMKEPVDSLRTMVEGLKRLH